MPWIGASWLYEILLLSQVVYYWSSFTPLLLELINNDEKIVGYILGSIPYPEENEFVAMVQIWLR